jgi:hypothetical protein
MGKSVALSIKACLKILPYFGGVIAPHGLQKKKISVLL